MLQKLYSRLHCLVGLLVLVSLAGCAQSVHWFETSSPETIRQHFAEKCQKIIREKGIISSEKYSNCIQTEHDKAYKDAKQFQRNMETFGKILTTLSNSQGTWTAGKSAQPRRQPSALDNCSVVSVDTYGKPDIRCHH